MSADQHRIVYINDALKPLRPWLDDSQVVEISANGPGAVYVERFGQTYMERHELPALTASAIVHLAERVAAYTGQAVNIERPLLSAALPNGDRFQAVLAPAFGCAPFCISMSAMASGAAHMPLPICARPSRPQARPTSTLFSS